MITVKDVRESTFSRSARGYKVNEIDDFLDEVADTIEKLTNENETLLKKMELLAAKVQEYRDDEDNIRAALVTAQRSSEQIIREANAQKEQILLDANAKAKTIVDDATQEADEKLKTSQEKSVIIVNETKEKATKVINEAKEKAGRMLTEAREGSREELERFEAIKKQALDFRSALIQMYKDQFEIIKNGGRNSKNEIAPEKTDVKNAEENNTYTKQASEEEKTVEPTVEPIDPAESEIPDEPEVPAEPEDIPAPVSNSSAGKEPKEESVAEESNGIFGGFKIDDSTEQPEINQFSFNMKGNAEQKTVESNNNDKKSGFFHRKK